MCRLACVRACMCAADCGSVCMLRNSNYIGLWLPGVGSILIVMASQGFFYFVVLFSVESGTGSRAQRTMSRLLLRRRNRGSVAPDLDELAARPSHTGIPGEDADVKSERQLILGHQSGSLETLLASNAIVVHALTKRFSSFRAVDCLTFRVPQVTLPFTAT